ncbi:MAG: MBL fold metallo-hydrolase [Eubacteriales bacterium]|nr:MBL fold metallo-hydrolase [Eubacteriales bacterium]
MKLTFIGAAHEVTGSCALLEACGKKILIDCGMEQGGDTYENADLPVSPSEIDAICLTHAHIDHSGMIPAMFANGYIGPVYATEATHRLCGIMLLDSAHIQEQEAQWHNKKAARSGTEKYEPIYTVEDAAASLKHFESYGYNEPVDIFKGITIRFIDAGHLLGSSSIQFTINEQGESTTILFSGDLGNVARPLIRDPQKPLQSDYVVIESTYGDRVHGERPDYIAQLTEIMNETFSKGGNLVIPSFAVGRTQELLYLFRIIKDRHLLKEFGNFLVYVDSPLAVEATKIYQGDLFDYYDDEALELLRQGINPINFPGLHLSITKEDSMAINFDMTPKVIISASGMCEAGRIRHHLKHNLWEERNTILFVGYQATGTLGRKLLDGATSVRLFGEEIQVKARIDSVVGISGHADRDMLLGWIGSLEKPPKRVFVNHGDDIICDSFAQTIQNKFQFDAIAPYSGDEYDLVTGERTKYGKIIKLTKVTEGRKRANIAYEKLIYAFQRLKVVIDLSKELSNKDLAKFTDQINSLCDKYARKSGDR